MMKGNCRYENNCAFYHPGVNGPPCPRDRLPPAPVDCSLAPSTLLWLL